MNDTHRSTAHEYTPHVWVIIKITTPEETLHKVLGGWYGGYLGENSWRMNSGIAHIEQDGEDMYHIHGYSGSVYHAHRECERTSMLTASVIESLKSNLKEGESVEIVPISEVMINHV